jgi:hypothetical protein
VFQGKLHKTPILAASSLVEGYVTLVTVTPLCEMAQESLILLSSLGGLRAQVSAPEKRGHDRES